MDKFAGVNVEINYIKNIKRIDIDIAMIKVNKDIAIVWIDMECI